MLHSRSIHASPSTANAAPPDPHRSGDRHPRERVVVGGVAGLRALPREPVVAVEHRRLPRREREVDSEARLSPARRRTGQPPGAPASAIQSPTHTRSGLPRRAGQIEGAPRPAVARVERVPPRRPSARGAPGRRRARAHADRRGAIVGASAVRKNVSWNPKRRAAPSLARSRGGSPSSTTTRCGTSGADHGRPGTRAGAGRGRARNPRRPRPRGPGSPRASPAAPARTALRRRGG